MATQDGPDYDAKCELCQENPARRSDIEYRTAHPDDPWMILCEECDKKTNGRTPPRSSSPSNFIGKDEFGPKASARRLEFLKVELRLDTAIFLRMGKKPLPKKFEWMNSLSEATVTEMAKECYATKLKYASMMYGPRGYNLIDEGIDKYNSICGTYQLMAGLGQFTGKKPEQPKEAQV